MSGVTTGEVQSTAPPAHARARHVRGEPELWIFILGDLTVFGLFFGVWGWNQAIHPDLFTWGQAHLSRGFGLVNTILLITSSAVVAGALELARRDQGLQASRAYLLAAALGSAFVVTKALEYREHARAQTYGLSNDFFMYYFVFTGIHLVHVIVGLMGLMFARWRCQRLRPGATDVGFLEGVGVYWHMVDLLWIVLFYLIYVA